MTTKYESADLILKLYDLRREATMRQARDWYAREFFPESFDDLRQTFAGPNSAYVRMVTSYWDMAASLVNNGAIDEQMFVDANGEQNMVLAKLQPFLAEARAQGNPKFLRHLEELVMRQPNAEESLGRLREMMKAWAKRPADQH